MVPGGRTAERIFGAGAEEAGRGTTWVSPRSASRGPGVGPEAAGVAAGVVLHERGRASGADAVRRLKSSGDCAGLDSKLQERHEDSQVRRLSPGALSPRRVDTSDRVFGSGGPKSHGGDGRAGAASPLRMLQSGTWCWVGSPEPGEEVVRSARAEDRAGRMPSPLWRMHPGPENVRNKEDHVKPLLAESSPQSARRSERAATPRGLLPGERDAQTPRRASANTQVPKSPRLAHTTRMEARVGTGLCWSNKVVAPKPGIRPDGYRSSSPLRPGVPGLKPEPEARDVRASGECHPLRTRTSGAPYAVDAAMQSKRRPSVRL